MKKSLRIILPMAKNNNVLDFCYDWYANRLPNSSISISFLLSSQKYCVSDYDEVLNAPQILKAVKAAIMDKCDGIFISVAFDTALNAAKCISPVPVVGALESSIAIAKQTSQRFSILAINQEEVLLNRNFAKTYNFNQELISIETIGILPHELALEADLTLEKMKTAIQKAKKKGAESIILGCTGMGWATAELQETFGIPILDSSLIGLYQLYSMCHLNICHSKKTYIYPGNLSRLSKEDYLAFRDLTFFV